MVSQLFIDWIDIVMEGEIIFHVREDITSKTLTNHKFSDYIEVLFIEINFRKCKWLL